MRLANEKMIDGLVPDPGGTTGPEDPLCDPKPGTATDRATAPGSGIGGEHDRSTIVDHLYRTCPGRRGDGGFGESDLTVVRSRNGRLCSDRLGSARKERDRTKDDRRPTHLRQYRRSKCYVRAPSLDNVASHAVAVASIDVADHRCRSP